MLKDLYQFFYEALKTIKNIMMGDLGSHNGKVVTTEA